jgi:hypothetical protein
MLPTDEVILKATGKNFKKTKKLLKYMNMVFHFKDVTKDQRDFRKKQHVKTRVIFTILFWAFILRVKSFNQLEQMIKYGCFKPLFTRKTKMPSIDAISDILTLWDIERLRISFQRVIQVLNSKKTFIDGTIDGYTVCAFDGSDIIKTSKKKCRGCALMKNGSSYYYVHKSIVAMVIGQESNYVLDYGMTKVKSEETGKDRQTGEEIVLTKSEGELTVATDLLSKLPSWVDVIVGDALYFNAPFVKEVLKNGKHAVIRLKDKTSNAYQTINHKVMYSRTEGSFVIKDPYAEATVSYWKKDTKLTDSNLLKNDPEKYVEIRLYKFIEVIETNIKGKQQFTFREVFVGTTDENMPPESVWKIIRKRWYIENTCFNQLKSYCFMEHCFRHDETAIEAILGIMFMAFNIMQSYLFKRIRKFRENFRKKKETISWFATELSYELVTLSFLFRYKLIPDMFLYSP